MIYMVTINSNLESILETTFKTSLIEIIKLNK